MPVPSAQVVSDSLNVLRTLSQRQELDVAGVPQECDVPANRVPDVVAALVRWGLVAAAGDTAQSVRVRLRAVPCEKPAPARTAVLTCWSELAKRVEQLQRSARFGLMAVYADRPPSPSEIAASVPADIAALRRGVRMQVTFPLSFLDVPHVTEYAALLGRHGASVGYLPKPGRPFVLVDDVTALIPLEIDAAEPTVIMTGDTHLCRSLLELGRRVDASAWCETDARAARSSPQLTPGQRRVLELLYAGMTDLAAAKKLGITDRTVRRHVAEVCRLLGARSRFEAGARAVERGLI